jgi:hypothetical protein
MTRTQKLSILLLSGLLAVIGVFVTVTLPGETEKAAGFVMMIAGGMAFLLVKARPTKGG